jgi:hypothetical protein
MNVVLSEKRTGRKTRTAGTTITVRRSGSLVGAMLLNAAGRTQHCTPDIPADVVLKVLVRFTRGGEVGGEVRGRDGATYVWCVLGREEVGAEPAA